MPFQTTVVDSFKGRVTTLDPYRVPPAVSVGGYNTVVGLDGRKTKLPAPVALHAGLTSGQSIASFYSFRQASGLGHWWLYDAGANTYAFDVFTGIEYLLRVNANQGIWSNVQINNVLFRCSNQGEMVLLTSAASGTTAKTWGIAAPAAAPTVSASGTGSLTSSNGGWAFGFAYVDGATGHVGALSPMTGLITASAKAQFDLSALTDSTNPRVTKKYLFASFDGGFQPLSTSAPAAGNLYLVQNADGTPFSVNQGTTTGTITAANFNINAQVLAPFYNQPPPTASYIMEYQDRIFFWGLANANQVVYTSIENILLGTREECVPAGFNSIIMPDRVEALGKTPNGLLFFHANKMRLLTGTIQDTIPSGQFVFGQSNLNIPNISERLITLPFDVGTRSPYTVANDPNGNCWFFSNDMKIYSTDGVSVPQEQGAMIRPDLKILDETQKQLFRGAYLSYGDRSGYCLLGQRSN